MSFKTKFTCSVCGEWTEQPGTGGGDTVFLVQHGAPSIAHQPCKTCKPLVEAKSNKTLLQKEAIKLAEQQQAAAQAAPTISPIPQILPYGQPQYQQAPMQQQDPYMAAFGAVYQLLTSLNDHQRELMAKLDHVQNLLLRNQDMRQAAALPPPMVQPMFNPYAQPMANPYAQAIVPPPPQYMMQAPQGPTYGLPPAQQQLLQEMMRDR